MCSSDLLDKARGALVASVTGGSPADSGHIKSGDIILSFNGKDVSEMQNLPRTVADTKNRTMVKVEVWRGSKVVATELTGGELSEEQVAARPARPGGRQVLPRQSHGSPSQTGCASLPW